MSNTFEDFHPDDIKQFNLKGPLMLALDVNCNVRIVEGKNKEVLIQTEASRESLSSFEFRQKGDTIAIQAKETTSGGFNFTSNGKGKTINITADHIGSIFTGNGATLFGQKINSKNFSRPTGRMARILITVPSGSDLLAELEGSGKLTATANHRTAKIKAIDDSVVGIVATSVEANLQDNAELKASIKSGALQARLQDNGKLNARGPFSTIDLKVSDLGNASTEGEVTGNYTTRTGDMGTANHKGQVKGRVSQSKMGFGK